MVGAARQGNGRKEQTSFCIVDSQSVKNTDSAEAKGYDAGKKVSGIKRHIAVDTEGLPDAIFTDRAAGDVSRTSGRYSTGGRGIHYFAEGVQSLLWQW